MINKILHLSDLHFGTERQGIIESLHKSITSINPDLIIISGDLTQRARIKQYQAARDFIQCYKHIPFVSVPGNHDIALYNLIERFLFTYSYYNKYINCPWQFQQENIAVLGINSVTPYKPMSGYVTKEQLHKVKNYFKNIPSTTLKIVVMHHNLVRSERHKVINDAEEIINTFAASNVNLVLAGHIHFANIELLKRNYIAHNMYIITAGTAISTRTMAPNSFNLIEINNKEFIFTVHEHQQSNEFTVARQEKFQW